MLIGDANIGPRETRHTRTRECLQINDSIVEILTC